MALKKSIGSYFKDINIQIFNNIKIPFRNEAGEVIEERSHQQLAGQQSHRIEVPQIDVEMHPIEEAEILASWGVGDIQKLMPKPITAAQEHEWLIEHGADYVKQKRQEWQALTDSFKPQLDAAIAVHAKASQAYMEWVAGEGKDYHSPLLIAHENAALDNYMSKIGYAKNPPVEESTNAVT